MIEPIVLVYNSLMSIRADRILGTPESFSGDPEARKNQYTASVMRGHLKIRGRFGALANNGGWMPTRHTVLFCETPEELGAFIDSVGFETSEDQKTGLMMSHGLSDVRSGRTAFNMTEIRNPAQLLFVSAHETVHQWSGGAVPRMPETKRLFEEKLGIRGREVIEHLEREALESAIDYTVCEALGLIDTDADFGENFALFLIREARMMRRIYSFWGSDGPAQAFRVTQGGLPEEEQRVINSVMGNYPGDGEVNNFFEQGLLMAGGLIHREHRFRDEEKANGFYGNVLSWMYSGMNKSRQDRESVLITT